MEQHAVDAAPSAAQLERHGVPELGDGEDAGAVKPLLHARADAVDLSCNSSPEQNLLIGLRALGDLSDPGTPPIIRRDDRR